MAVRGNRTGNNNGTTGRVTVPNQIGVASNNNNVTNVGATDQGTIAKVLNVVQKPKVQSNNQHTNRESTT